MLRVLSVQSPNEDSVALSSCNNAEERRGFQSTYKANGACSY